MIWNYQNAGLTKNFTSRLIQNTCHFRDVLSGQSVGMIVKKTLQQTQTPSAFLWRYEPVRRTGKSDDWLTIFFARTIRFTVQKFQLFWVIFCSIIFFIELWHILILWLAKMPNGGMPVFTLIATGWRYRKIFFYKKALQTPHQWNEIRHMVKYFWTLLSSRSSYVLVHWTLFAVYVLIFCAAIWSNKRRW